MPELSFHVERAEAEEHAAAPLLILKLRITELLAGQEATSIPAIALRCQVRIEPTRRRYSPPEQARLLDLFGEPARWGQTLRSALWTHTSVMVPTFTSTALVDLPVPCTFDFNVAATKYFHALDDGEVPLCLLFSGTIFYLDPDGFLQISQIPWEKEANFRLPVSVWKEMMDHYYPNSAWLCLEREAFDGLFRFKTTRGIPTWEQAIEVLLETANEKVNS